MAVEFGLSLPAGPPKGQIDRWLADLDAVVPVLAGHFKSLWMTDHFFWEDAPTYECWTALTYVAARYPQFDIGPIVLGQSYRNPALTAKMAATLQALSGGRLIMGIGAGWKEDEYHAYGYPYPRAGIRIEQLRDTLEIFKRLWTTPGRVSYEGQHYSIKNAYCEPKPDPVPPLLVGGGGNKTTRLAAEYADWWNIPDTPFDLYRERAAVLHGHCADIGRDPASIRLSWFGRLVLGRTEADAQALGGGQWTSANAFAGTPDQVIAQMTPFVDLGVSYFMLEVLGLPDAGVIDMLLNDVLPRFG
ncbi:MAG: LLM class flavin-dependent oxidoreductase [Anaerolineae bacterium]|jgi:alkanesulfonate monooxygenase SsuD/methylene tetrahydromethanopterin reductase-like flavin-dependent oxidoreductase (luciferase family)|nr:LLM class flavin-dependent oxidoreductase [Anaerolineae bacterium]